MAPTFLSIDHSLSLSTTMSRRVWCAMLFRASYVIPQVNAASPASAMTCSLPPMRSRATAIPSAAESAVAVVLALRTQHETAESAGSANGVELLPPPGEQLVHIGLVAHVENEMVPGRVKNIVHGQREFDHAQVRPEMAAGLRQH